MRQLSFTRSLEDKVHGLLSRPAEELSRAQRTVRYCLEFVRYCAQELRADRAGEMAAALTYHTLFSLLPMLALMLAILPVFVSQEDREQLKNGVVDFTLQWILEEEQTADTPEEQARETVEALQTPPGEADDPTVELPVVPNAANTTAAAAGGEPDREQQFLNLKASLDDNVREIMSQLESIDFRSIGIVGVLLFIYAATKLLTTVEHSFNRIFDAPYARPLHVRLPLYYAAITLAPLLLAGGQFVQVQVASTLQNAAQVAGQTVGFTPVSGGEGGADLPGVGFIGRLVSVVTPFVMTWIVLTLMYKFLPNTRVKITAALTGGCLAAAVLIVAIEFFKVYVSLAGTANLYGALAMVPLFMLWLWAMWLIVLFGVEITYTSQSMRGKRFKSLQRQEERGALFDARWVVPIAARIAEAFDAGKPTTLDELKALTGLPNRAIAQILFHLTEAGFVYHVDQPDPSQPSYTLARPPQRIRVHDLLETVRRATMQDKKWQALPGNGLMVVIRDAEQQAAADHTLAEAIAEARDRTASDEPAASLAQQGSAA